MGVGLTSGLFLAKLTVAVFVVVPRHTRASGVGCLNLMGSMTSGFASLAEGRWKASTGIAHMMNYAALTCLGTGLLLIICIRFYFQKDYQRVRENMEPAPTLQERALAPLLRSE